MNLVTYFRCVCLKPLLSKGFMQHSSFKSLHGFESRRLTLKDEAKVLALIDESYSEDSAAQYGLQKEDLDKLNTFRVRQNIKQNISSGTFDLSSNELVAVGLLAIVDKSRDISVKFYEANGLKLSEGAKDYIRLFESLEADMFRQTECNEVLYGCFATIHHQYRSLGLLKPMFENSVVVAGEQGLKYVIGTATHEYVIEQHRKSGAAILKEIKFSEYVDTKTGLNPFKHRGPRASRIQLVCLRV